MNEAPNNSYITAFEAFGNYIKALQHLVTVMGNLGISTRNVDPYANFAEVLVAHHFSGKLQPATNAGFDVITHSGIKVQVKSLRISSKKPLDNGRGWYECTRIGGKQTGALIDTQLLAIVIYLDHSPHCLLVFPIELRDSFPIVNVKGLNFYHIQKLLAGKYADPEGAIGIHDLDQLGFAKIQAESIL